MELYGIFRERNLDILNTRLLYDLGIEFSPF
jgi:hypothetical protein